MSFHDVVFPAALSFGSSGGPERRTEIVAFANGAEQRNASWAHARRRYDAGLGLRGLDDVHAVITFFEARMGMLHAFRWLDWADSKSCPPSEEPSAFDQPLGVGDGSTVSFALARVYASGGSEYRRPITKPVMGSVKIGMNGAELAEGDFTVDHQTGEVSFAEAPAPDAVLTAGFMFHVPVRFDTDMIEVNLAAFEAGEIPSIPIVEVRV